MGRPKKQNPKIKHIGIVTTEEKFRRYKALGLVGDEAIDVLLYHLENDNMKLNIQKSQSIRKIKSLREEIESLEFEVLKEQTKLDQLNSEIGVAESGLSNDVSTAISNVFQRYEKDKEIYSIGEFVELRKNKLFIEHQASLCGMDIDDFKELLIENA